MDSIFQELRKLLVNKLGEMTCAISGIYNGLMSTESWCIIAGQTHGQKIIMIAIFGVSDRLSIILYFAYIQDVKL